MRYIKNTMGIVEKQKLEIAHMKIAGQASEQERQTAKLDYIAMMADIELSDIESEEEGVKEGVEYAESEIQHGKEVLRQGAVEDWRGAKRR